MHQFTVTHMETAIQAIVKKKLRKIERRIAHLEYRMSILSVKSLNNLLDVSDEEIQKEIREIQHEIEISENLYNALMFEFNCIRYTLVGVLGMLIYVFISYMI